MNRPLRLNVGNHWLTVEDFKKDIPRIPRSDQETKAIRLCQDWLAGKQDFEFHTSGSSGAPKIIQFTRNQLESSARLTEEALHLQQGYTALICLDTSFIAGAMMVIRSLVTGMNMIVKTPSANPLTEITEPLDFVSLVPYQLTTVLEQTPSTLDNLRKVIVGGALLPANIIDRLQGLSPDFYATYGMTETITHVALQKLNGQDKQDYLQLLPGIQAITDDRGCLVLTAPHLGPHSIITNDVVTLLDQKRFRWLGRFDRVINSGGIKVQPEKIENALENIFAHQRINMRFFVSGIPDQKLGERVALIIEDHGAGLEYENTILAMLAKQVNAYEVPKTVLYTNHFIETPTQKIDRMATMKSLSSL